MSDDKPARETIEEDARIDALEQRLNAAQQRENQRNQPKMSGADANYRSGNRVLADLLGGILGGAVIGWTVDWFAGTSPWGLLVGLFLGIIVAFRNIIRAANKRPDE
ncbi:AtpZ/AtpI family protein [Qipengyuania sp. XHP0211]|jgi:ATP synthase protein I|uniref:ATP synthase protein I n=1 Tax=Qipengyuania profundimaris TaxID=3067652 RepID=A0ABT9HRQ1_9SPHN|nr:MULTISPECIES: AtpZ/AtpI family protein [unclassified Qipengyuania]MDG5751009.1 AtpZ/AtpI family protein [Qipengyuania sp. XHP0211]MDP4575507.1 AtpZ/AtpI family protein [Qipengyuania sp. G39]